MASLPSTLSPSNESIYATPRRYYYFKSILENLPKNREPLRIIELGCGTGEGLLIPLAESLRGSAAIVGIDSDAQSIERAQSKVKELGLSNVIFLCSDFDRLPSPLTNPLYDVVITSEIIEHCENPTLLLKRANQLMKKGGVLLATVPNGYGPFEVESFFWNFLNIERWGRRLRSSAEGAAGKAAHTLNDENTHVGFYTFREVTRLIQQAGFELVDHENRELFCGPFSDHLTRRTKKIGLGGLLIRISHGAAKFAPSFMVADWMLVARKEKEAPDQIPFDLPKGPLRQWWWKIKRRQNKRGL